MGFISGVMVHNSDPGVLQEQGTVGTFRVVILIDWNKRTHLDQIRCWQGKDGGVKQGSGTRVGTTVGGKRDWLSS